MYCTLVNPMEPIAPPIPPTPYSEASPYLDPELIPNLDDLVTEDGAPVESVFTEKQYRLLTEPLYASWVGPGEGRPFCVMANVRLFYAVAEPPACPDVMLAVDVAQPKDLTQKENRSYFVWIRGKVPDALVEIVSQKPAGEDDYKMKQYARWHVPYYIIFDPLKRLSDEVLRAFRLVDGKYEPMNPSWFPGIGLGLRLWTGVFEGEQATWLRWCDERGQVIPTGAERATTVEVRAQAAEDRAERLAAQLRQLGVDPNP